MTKRKTPYNSTFAIGGVSFSADSFVVELPRQNFSIEIFDVTGQKLYYNKSDLGKMQIDCSAFTNGIYFIRVEGEKSFFIQKIIVLH